MDKMTSARKKCARGTLMTLLYNNQSAAMMVRTLEYAMMQDDAYITSEIGSHLYYLADKGYVKLWQGDEPCSMASNPPREALVRLTSMGIDLMEETIEDDGIAFGDPSRQ